MTMVERSRSENHATILVADAHPAVARAVARVLETDDRKVFIASTLREAQELIRSAAPDIAIMGLEGEEGLQLLVDLAHLPGGPEVMVHTESSNSAAATWATGNHIPEVFEKPVPPRVLLDWTKRLIRRRRGEPESITKFRSNSGLGRLLGQSSAMDEIREELLRVAEFPLMSVLICGETGTGKELVARAIHELTNPDAPFVSLNCAAIPESLFESELFGHSAGAFTGAKGRRVGLLEEAKDGTFFLDEVGELPPTMQPKLLRVLENRSFRPVGSNREIPLQARIVSATNRRLADALERFRSDLYYRLAGFTVDTPALRHRREDITLLSRSFLRDFCRIHGRPVLKLDPPAEDVLKAQRWPGNVRELRGVVESAAVAVRGCCVSAEDVHRALQARGAAARARSRTDPPPASLEAATPKVSSASQFPPPSSGLSLVGESGAFPSLPELEQHVISDVYRECGQNLSLAARTLGIPRSTLRDRLKRYGLTESKTAKGR